MVTINGALKPNYQSEYRGTSGADNIYVDSYGRGSTVKGLGGNDLIRVNNFNVSYRQGFPYKASLVLEGGDGNDTFRIGKNVKSSDGGNPLIAVYGGPGTDTLQLAGTQNDWYGPLTGGTLVNPYYKNKTTGTYVTYTGIEKVQFIG